MVLLHGMLQVLMKPGDMVLVSTLPPELPLCTISTPAAVPARVWHLTLYHCATCCSCAWFHPPLQYEGASCAHGRPNPLVGRFMANVFLQ